MSENTLRESRLMKTISVLLSGILALAAPGMHCGTALAQGMKKVPSRSSCHAAPGGSFGGVFTVRRTAPSLPFNIIVSRPSLLVQPSPSPISRNFLEKSGDVASQGPAVSAGLFDPVALGAVVDVAVTQEQAPSLVFLESVDGGMPVFLRVAEKDTVDASGRMSEPWDGSKAHDAQSRFVVATEGLGLRNDFRKGGFLSGSGRLAGAVVPGLAISRPAAFSTTLSQIDPMLLIPLAVGTGAGLLLGLALRYFSPKGTERFKGIELGLFAGTGLFAGLLYEIHAAYGFGMFSLALCSTLLAVLLYIALATRGAELDRKATTTDRKAMTKLRLVLLALRERLGSTKSGRNPVAPQSSIQKARDSLEATIRARLFIGYPSWASLYARVEIGPNRLLVYLPEHRQVVRLGESRILSVNGTYDGYPVDTREIVWTGQVPTDRLLHVR